MNFRNTINNWKRGASVKVCKVRAHPERHKNHLNWSWDDIGIWTADRVAGRDMTSETSLKAGCWLKRIGAKSLVVIEETDGTPFIGSVRERISKRDMEKYWEDRDEWRVKDLLPRKWAGTNMAMAFSLLRRNVGLEDHATMSRLASGKKWDYQRYNVVLCKACQGDFRGPSHPLLKCSNLAITAARNLWLANCKEHIRTAKPARVRNKLSELLHHIWTSEGGEFAAVGTFIPGWVARVDEPKIMSVQELASVKKFLRVVAGGARLVMREYSRLKEVSDGDARELRQLSIAQFTKADVAKPPKTIPRTEHFSSPSDNVWEATDIQGRLRWSARREEETAEPGTATRALNGKGSKLNPRRTNPWKTGLNWFSPRTNRSLNSK
jgi:hypothetical protein